MPSVSATWARPSPKGLPNTLGHRSARFMYAINHAATALLLKKKQPAAPMWLLLLSVQLVEVFWVILSYFGFEHTSFSQGKLHLDFLPYSHSVFSG